MHGRWIRPVAAGLAFGVLSALGEARFDALASSLSTWLVAPFVVGAFAATRREAALAGLATCAFQLIGYYLVAHETTVQLVAFWTAGAVVGGPLFALAGQAWRTGARGLGMAVLAGVFVAEGLYAYAHQLHDYVTGVVFIATGLALAVWSSRGRVEQWRWLGLTVPLGLAGEAAVTSVLRWL